MEQPHLLNTSAGYTSCLVELQNDCALGKPTLREMEADFFTFFSNTSYLVSINTFSNTNLEQLLSSGLAMTCGILPEVCV